MPRPRTLSQMRRFAAAAHVRILRDHFKQDQTATTDAVWEQRRIVEGWRNVSRLHTYLARRRVYEAGGDPWSVYAPMPSLGPEATPENVMDALLKVDRALRTGDFEEVEFMNGDEKVSLGKPALPHHDTTLAPYDGPMGLVIAGKEDGTNVPARRSKPLGSA